MQDDHWTPFPDEPDSASGNDLNGELFALVFDHYLDRSSCSSPRARAVSALTPPEVFAALQARLDAYGSH